MSEPTTFDSLRVKASCLVEKTVVATYSTAGAITMTAADLIGGIILRNTNGAGRADLVPTVASLFTAVGEPKGDISGLSFEFVIRNTAGAAETITVTTNTGWTLSGTMTIAQNNSKRFKVVFTSPTAATLYSLGTIVH